jgi:xanthine dehydrogenase large subunit
MLAISTLLAIRDAIASCGPALALPDLVAPATPEAVLRCLENINAGTIVYKASAVKEEAGA